MADEKPTGRYRPTDSEPDPQGRLEELIAHSIDAPLVAEVLQLQSAPDVADALERLDEEEQDMLVAEQLVAEQVVQLMSQLMVHTHTHTRFSS